MLDYLSLISKYINPDSPLYKIYLIHCTLVTNKSLKIAQSLHLSAESLQFIEESVMLHDIGIVNVKAPNISCFGQKDYICHGIEGYKILNHEGLASHANVAKRHTGGIGISKEEITKNHLPLPIEDLQPISIEEKIIAYADIFFTKKSPEIIWQECTVEQARKRMIKFGEDKGVLFDKLKEEFETD